MEYKFSSGVSNIKGSAIREILKSENPGMIPFSAGNPSTETFPVKMINNIIDDILKEDSATALQYGITEGYTPLRDLLKERLTSQMNIVKEFDDVVIVSGAQQGIRLISETMCNARDTIICESPSFVGALNAFRALDVNIAGVPLESDGMDIEALEKAIRESHNPKIIYIIPTFQNPTGGTTSLSKRKAVYKLAKKYNLIILEDNPYEDLRYFGEKIPTIKSMDEDGIVAYCGSFSKILSPGMRVGYLAAPQEILQKAVIVKQGQDVHTSMMMQMTCYRFFKDYTAEAHIVSLQELYRKKLILMLDEMKKEFSDKILYTKPEGGLFLWCKINGNGDATAFAKNAVKNNVTIVPGVAFATKQGDLQDCFRMNFSTPTNEDIIKGIKILGRMSYQL